MVEFSESRARSLFVTLAGTALVCLYMGFTFASTAPMSADEPATQRWYATHDAAHLALKIVGALLLIVALTSLSGRRGAVLLAALGLGLFALLMLANAALFGWQDFVQGSFDIFTVIMIVLAGIGAYEAAHAYRLYSTTVEAPVDDA